MVIHEKKLDSWDFLFGHEVEYNELQIFISFNCN